MYQLLSMIVSFNIATTALPSLNTASVNWIDVPIEDVSSKPNKQLIKIDRASKRIYLFGEMGTVISYPVSIGKKGWETPVGRWYIRNKIINPSWTNFKTREVVPPGKSNPLGSRWIGFWTDGRDEIGFHATQNVKSIGKADSFGCIRLREIDIQDLFDRISIGTEIIIN